MIFEVPGVRFSVPDDYRDQSLHRFTSADGEVGRVSYSSLVPEARAEDVVAHRRADVVEGLKRFSAVRELEEVTTAVSIAGREGALLVTRFAADDRWRHDHLAVARTSGDERVEIHVAREARHRGVEPLISEEVLALLGGVHEASVSPPRAPAKWIHVTLGRLGLHVPRRWSTPRHFVFAQPEQRTRLRMRLTTRRGMPQEEERALLFEGADEVEFTPGETRELLAGRERLLFAVRSRPQAELDGEVHAAAVREQIVMREAWLPLRRGVQLELLAAAPARSAEVFAEAWHQVAKSVVAR